MINAKEILIINSTDSNIVAKNNNKYYLEAIYYNEDKKSLFNYDIDTENLNELLSVSLEHKFFSDIYNKKIYCYNIDNNTVKIYRLENNKLVNIIERKVGYDINNIEVFAIKDYFFIRIQKDEEIKNNPMECIMFSLETKQFYNVIDFAFVNTIYMPQCLVHKKNLYIVLEESYVSSNEIPQIREIYGNSEYTSNRIIIYKFDDFISEVKSGESINKKVIAHSRDSEYLSLLGVKDDKIIIFNSNEECKINYINLKGEIAETIIGEKVSFMINNEDIFFIGYSNDQIIVISSNNEIIYSSKINYDEEKSICGILDNKYIVFDINKYDLDGNMYKIRQVYDFINNEEKTYNCNFIRIKNIIV